MRKRVRRRRCRMLGTRLAGVAALGIVFIRAKGGISQDSAAWRASMEDVVHYV